MARIVPPAVRFVAGEQTSYPAVAVARQGHQGTAEVMKEHGTVFGSHPGSRVQFEDEHGVEELVTPQTTV